MTSFLNDHAWDFLDPWEKTALSLPVQANCFPPGSEEINQPLKVKSEMYLILFCRRVGQRRKLPPFAAVSQSAGDGGYHPCDPQGQTPVHTISHDSQNLRFTSQIFAMPVRAAEDSPCEEATRGWEAGGLRHVCGPAPAGDLGSPPAPSRAHRLQDLRQNHHPPEVPLSSSLAGTITGHQGKGSFGYRHVPVGIQ